MSAGAVSGLGPVTIVVGSHHADSQSLKVARHLAWRATRLGLSDTVSLLDLGALKLPLWETGITQRDPETAAAWSRASDRLQASEAVVLVVPEWGGMVPAAVKNLLLYCENHELAHKAGLLVGVSSGENGAYPVAEMRMSSAKNTRLCFVPDHLVVRRVEHVLDGTEARGEEDRLLRARIDYTLRVLFAYAAALTAVRRSGVIDLQAFPYGQ